MKKSLCKFAVIAGVMAVGGVYAQGNQDLSLEEKLEGTLDASIRFGLELNTEPDAELSFNNYESQVRWGGSTGLNDSLSAFGYVELGFDQTGGLDETREAWVGLQTDFGIFTGGTQYTAFYDAVSVDVDIAFFGGCIFEIGCDRQQSQIKYTGPSDGDLQVFASTILVQGDADNDFVDGIDAGVRLTSGDLTLGVGASLLIGNAVRVTDNLGNTFNLDLGTGFALGASATLPLGEGTASGTLQYANDDYTNGFEDTITFTAAYSSGPMYALFSVSDSVNTPFGFGYGYTYPIVDDRAYIHFEASVEEADRDDQDVNVLGRAIFQFDFDVLNTSS